MNNTLLTSVPKVGAALMASGFHGTSLWLPLDVCDMIVDAGGVTVGFFSCLGMGQGLKLPWKFPCGGFLIMHFVIGFSIPNHLAIGVAFFFLGTLKMTGVPAVTPGWDRIRRQDIRTHGHSRSSSSVASSKAICRRQRNWFLYV